jgi:hypothetical protein
MKIEAKLRIGTVEITAVTESSNPQEISRLIAGINDVATGITAFRGEALAACIRQDLYTVVHYSRNPDRHDMAHREIERIVQGVRDGSYFPDSGFQLRANTSNAGDAAMTSDGST